MPTFIYFLLWGALFWFFRIFGAGEWDSHGNRMSP